ncbi:hypothetical protein [Pediococcus ethanolidurans]|uniref:hypothetical protein n=1 Tax=Pediococcus ethanolidurans TaxID=319653 RepID=UPI001C1F10F8|nr:hypothetical protein [Pediococcus ethanolidurans]MBU7554064.1 hypothetical protein [Pediococcus ethanolidurans]
MEINADVLKSQITFKPQKDGVDPFLSWCHIKIDGIEYPRGGKSLLKKTIFTTKNAIKNHCCV